MTAGWGETDVLLWTSRPGAWRLCSIAIFFLRVALWCRDSTGRFLPVRSQKRHVLPLFSDLTLFLAFAVHWRSWRGLLMPAWLCGSFSG